MIYAFGAFELDTELFELRQAGVPVAVEPQVFDVLAYLIERRAVVVTQEELLDNVWGSRFVSASALTSRIKSARRAVNDDGRQQQVIRTVHGRGYRFVALVRPASSSSTAEEDRILAVPSRWPMVGRSQELDELVESFQVRDAGGVVLTGGAGVGKTCLAEECLALVANAGWPTARASGHPEGRSIPFVALAHLLPRDIAAGHDLGGDLDRGVVFHRARAALRDLAGEHRLFLLIDDADQLDDLSRALLVSLVQSRTVFAVLTVRTASGATPFDDLVKDGLLLRLPILPLAGEVIETLPERVLGGPVVAESAARLREAAVGNPGIMRQLVETALDTGNLAEHDGVWRLLGPLQPTPSLEGLVAERLEGLDEDHRVVAELLAIAGELGLHGELAAVTDHTVLEDLEGRGLLAVRSAGRRSTAALAHPLFCEVLLQQLPSLRGRRLRARLAEVLDQSGARRRDDQVRLVAWRIDGGGDLDPELVLGVARLALLEGDDAIAERLIRRAADATGAGSDVGPAAAQLMAEVHFRRREPALVETTLAAIDLTELSEHERARVVRRRSGNLYYDLTDAAGALAVIDESAPFFDDEESKRAVATYRATILSMEGQIGEAVRVTDDLIGTTEGGLRFEVLRARSLALAAAGRGEDALSLIAEAGELFDVLSEDLTRPGRSILLFNELLSLTELGRLDEARERVRVERAAGAVGAGSRATWLAFAIPRFELLAGRPEAALAACEQWALEARARGHFGAERWLLSLSGMARLLAGDADGGARDIERVVSLWPEDVGLFRSDRDRAIAWLAADRGEHGEAIRILLDGAASARRRGAYVLEATLLHDVVRFGDAGEVADRLDQLAATLQGGLMAARADHAAGVRDADQVRLAVAVERFERLGSSLMAAEAALDLAAASAV